jgi:carbon-monoxide dehydrogenase medium subunit
MFPGQFDYYRAESVSAALDLLAEHSESETAVLAGGHSLLPAMKAGEASPAVVVDIGRIEELQGIDTVDGVLTIGAATRYRDLLDAAGAHDAVPALTATVRQIGDRQVRNRGTLGGNLAQADPASDLPAAALVSDVTLVARGPDGEREIPVEDFLSGAESTTLAPGELLTRIDVPTADGAVGTYVKKPSPSSGWAMVGVAALVDLDGDTVRSARVAANGVLDHGVRLPGVEAALDGATLDTDTIEAAADHAADGLDTDRFRADLDATATFRERLLTVYTKRTLADVAERATAPVAGD